MAVLEAASTLFSESGSEGRPDDGRLTLEQRLESAWRAVRAQGAAECPVCGSRLSLRAGASECEGCGSRLG